MIIKKINTSLLTKEERNILKDNQALLIGSRARIITLNTQEIASDSDILFWGDKPNWEKLPSGKRSEGHRAIRIKSSQFDLIYSKEASNFLDAFWYFVDYTISAIAILFTEDEGFVAIMHEDTERHYQEKKLVLLQDSHNGYREDRRKKFENCGFNNN